MGISLAKLNFNLFSKPQPMELPIFTLDQNCGNYLKGKTASPQKSPQNLSSVFLHILFCKFDCLALNQQEYFLNTISP